jgi:hypothetical protein
MDTDPQPPLPCPLINTALPQSNNPLFQLRVPLVELQKMVALGPISPLLSCPRGLLGLSCCSTPSCPCATTPRVEKSPGSCPRPRPVPLHQEPGSERSSSRTRGAHLASDGPQLQGPRGLSTIRRPAVRAQRRRRAWNVVQGAAPGRSQCRCRQSSSSVGERGLQSSTAKRYHFESKNSRACYRDSLRQSSTRSTDTFKGRKVLLLCSD